MVLIRENLANELISECALHRGALGGGGIQYVLHCLIFVPLLVTELQKDGDAY